MLFLANQKGFSIILLQKNSKNTGLQAEKGLQTRFSVVNWSIYNGL